MFSVNEGEMDAEYRRRDGVKAIAVKSQLSSLYDET